MRNGISMCDLDSMYIDINVQLGIINFDTDLIFKQNRCELYMQIIQILHKVYLTSFSGEL